MTTSYESQRITVSRAVLDSLADQLIDADCAFRDAADCTDVMLASELREHGRSCVRIAREQAAELLRHAQEDDSVLERRAKGER